MPKAFITGAGGFLGANLTRELINQDWEVMAFHLPSDNLENLSGLNIQRVAGDILDYASLLRAVPRDGDVTVFHLAGDTSMWKKHRRRQYEINVEGTKNVAEAALERSVKKLIFTSSISAFGYHRYRIDENTPSNALYCRMNYNKTKYLAELEIHKAVKNGLNATILNPCNMIGPYDPKGWSTLIQSAAEGRVPAVTLGVGTFAHVRDVALAHIEAAEFGKAGENYLIGGEEIVFKDIYRKIYGILGIKKDLKTYPAPLFRMAMYFIILKAFVYGKEPVLTYPRFKRLTGNIICDDSKARNELSFQTTTIDEMLEDSYRWLLNKGILER